MSAGPSRKKSAITPLLPVTINPGGVRYAPGVRAGPWIFATGHKGTADFVSGMAPDVLDALAPRHGLPKYKKEARHVFANFDKVLKAGGSRRDHVVRGRPLVAAHEARAHERGRHGVAGQAVQVTGRAGARRADAAWSAV